MEYSAEFVVPSFRSCALEIAWYVHVGLHSIASRVDLYPSRSAVWIGSARLDLTSFSFPYFRVLVKTQELLVLGPFVCDQRYMLTAGRALRFLISPYCSFHSQTRDTSLPERR